MSRPVNMSQAERAQRRRIILESLHSGMRPTDAAKRYGITVSRVNAIRAKSGEFEIGASPDRQHEMWDADEDRRRDYARDMAAAGARAALEAMERADG